MEILPLKQDISLSVGKAVKVLRAGGVVLYPTDTLYGLGADALSDKAVDKVKRIKGREKKKPIHCIVSDLGMAEQYAEVDDLARMLAKEFWPGALTLICKKQKGVEEGIARDIETIGIRIPAHPFCLALVRELGRPITTTSANKAGEAPEVSVQKILVQLGDAATSIDLAIDEGEKLLRAPSTVVDMTGAEPIILREGAIPAADIWNAVRTEP